MTFPKALNSLMSFSLLWFVPHWWRKTIFASHFSCVINYNFFLSYFCLLLTVDFAFSQINILNFINLNEGYLTSYTKLVHLILVRRVVALMILVLMLVLMIHVVLHATFLRQRAAVAANHLKRVRWQHRSVNRLQMLGCRGDALGKVGEIWRRWHLMHWMMMSEDCRRITFRVNCQSL